MYYNRIKYLKTFSKELTMILPAKEVKAAPPLSPILTQYGINANEFCERFNKETIDFPAGTLVPISVFYIPKDKKFEFCLRPFQLKFLFQQFVNFNPETNQYYINYIDLYKTLIIKSNIMQEENQKKIIKKYFWNFKKF